MGQEAADRHSTATPERHGVDTIPEAERTARPRDLVAILVGANLGFTNIVFGWLAVSYGLGLWAALTANIVGTLLGAAFVAPLALVGLRSGTNNSVGSGAYFGVRGRLIASVIGVLLSTGFMAVSVWAGGEAIVASLARLVDLPETDGAYAAGYALLAAAATLAAVYGFRWIVLLNRLAAPVMTAVIVLGLAAFWTKIDFSAPGDPSAYALGSFWPTWLLAMVSTGIAGPVSFVTLTGDWTRYISPRRHSGRAVVRATGLGMVAGLVVPQVFGVLTAVATFDPDAGYVAGLVHAAPAWFLVPILVCGLVGALGQSGIVLYGMGLDLDAILPRLSRVASTVLVAATSIGLVFLGKFGWDAEESVTTFVLVLTSLATPWAAITLTGMARTRARFSEPDLQVFNRRRRGGAYWYTAGWNLPATVSWVVGSAVGLLSNSSSSFTGPIADLCSGVDVSFFTSGVAGVVCYLLLTTAVRPRTPAASSEPSEQSEPSATMPPTVTAEAAGPGRR
ncbi:purine-cytosine permease family protein [Streptodolium elevatio]